MGKVVNIFLASSITDLHEDRIAIGEFINQLNKIYRSQDIFIDLHKCDDEAMNHSVCLDGTQKSLNTLIRESDLCFVIFWRKAGKITEEELRVALDAFKSHNSPKIVVYFKSLPSGEAPPDDIRQVKELVDREWLYYHREYSHIDSLKLGIITQLQVHGFLWADMRVEREHVTIAGHKVASTKNIPTYSQNSEYLELVSQCRKAEENCSRFLRQYCEDRGNPRLYHAYKKANKERTRLQEDLAELASRILQIGTGISKVVLSTVATERIREAIRRFDLGDCDGVLDILPPDELDCRFMEANIMEEQANMARRNGIEEYRLRILALEAQGKWREAQETYERVLIQVEGHPATPKTIMLEFAKFLYRQKKYQQSIEICEKLRAMLIQTPDAISNQELADLLDLQGELYYFTMRYADAERTLKEAIRQREAVAKQEPDKDILIAGSCVNLAKVYFMVNRHFEAEAQYRQALARYKSYDTEAIEPVDVDIARTSLELGDLYYMINRHQDAEKLFLDAYNKYHELVEYGQKQYTAALAESCNKISYLSIAIFSHRKTEHYYIEALKVKHLLTQAGASAYFLFLAHICDKLGHSWSVSGNAVFGNQILKEAERIHAAIQNNVYADSESEECRVLDYSFYERPINKPLIKRLCGESLKYYTLLADENPDAYAPSLARAYNVLGIFYTQVGEKTIAETYYMQAIHLREQLAQREPSMRTTLAYSYSTLAQHYFIWNQYELSAKYSRLAIDIYNDVCGKDAGAFDTDLARNYNAFANLHAKIGNQPQAEAYYAESILLYIKLYEKSPRAYVDRIINTVNNIVTLLEPLEATQWMDEFINESKLSDWLQRELPA